MITALQELGPDGPVAYYVLEEPGPILIGRGRGCSIRLDDTRISRHHCVLTSTAGQWHVEDLASTNGTWVNDQNIKRVALEDGNIITVGRLRLYFRKDMPPPDEGFSTDLEPLPKVSPNAAKKEGARTQRIPPEEHPFPPQPD